MIAEMQLKVLLGDINKLLRTKNLQDFEFFDHAKSDFLEGFLIVSNLSSTVFLKRFKELYNVIMLSGTTSEKATDSMHTLFYMYFHYESKCYLLICCLLM